MIAADSFLERIAGRYFSLRADLIEKVGLLRALRTRSEDARKRLLGPTLKTTQNSHRIKALETLIAKETAEAGPHFEELVSKLATIEMARQELHIYRVAERRTLKDRSEQDQRQLSALTYEFVDKLFTDFGIDGSALSTLTEADYQTIAEMAQARHRAAAPHLYPLDA